MAEQPLKIWFDRNGALLRLRLSRPKANIIDAEMIAALDGAFSDHAGNVDILAVLVDHDGPHFSFGASIQEHLPGQCDAMLKAMNDLTIRMVECPVPILVAVSGQCLGGGLEVAAAGNFIFAAPGAKLGQPEIKVGVFAPAASCLLPELIGQARAEDMLYSGRSLSAAEALAAGLVLRVDDDPEAAALAYFDDHLAANSAAVLRLAVQAARGDFAARVKARLGVLEKLYLGDLMATRDAVEGLEAFIEKRPAKWQNR